MSADTIANRRIEGIRATKASHIWQQWRPRGGPYEWGWKTVIRQGRKVRIPHKAERALMQYIVRCRDVEHMSWRQVCDDVERRYAQADGRKPRPFGFQRFSQYRLRCAYKAEKRIQAEYAEHARAWKKLHGHLDVGVVYDLGEMRFEGWAGSDGIRHVYSNPCSFFDADGRFLGPDESGLEPLFLPRAVHQERLDREAWEECHRHDPVIL